MARNIVTHASMESFFQELVVEAIQAERLSLNEDGTAYLVQLVTEFTDSGALHEFSREGEPGTPALVWLYERAVEAAPREQFNAFRHLGDVALVVSGFFAPHIERSLVGVDYYVQMGCAAYYRAAALARKSGFSALLAHLASTYHRLVEVLTRVAEQTTLPVARDIAALYERWLRNCDNLDLFARLRERKALPTVCPVEVIG